MIQQWHESMTRHDNDTYDNDSCDNDNDNDEYDTRQWRTMKKEWHIVQTSKDETWGKKTTTWDRTNTTRKPINGIEKKELCVQWHITKGEKENPILLDYFYIFNCSFNKYCFIFLTNIFIFFSDLISYGNSFHNLEIL